MRSPRSRRPRACGRPAAARAGSRPPRRMRRARRRAARRGRRARPASRPRRPRRRGPAPRARRAARRGRRRRSAARCRPRGRAGRRCAPAPRRDPSRSTTTASQVRSTSSSTCDENSTRMPRSRERRRTSSSISSRPCGSRPLVGSSSTTSSGECTSACASLTRWRMPVENVPIRRRRSSSSPTWKSTSLARSTAMRRGSPRSSPEVHHEIARRHPAGQALVLRHVADAAPQLEPARDRVDAEQARRAGVRLARDRAARA